MCEYEHDSWLYTRVKYLKQVVLVVAWIYPAPGCHLRSGLGLHALS